jgi:3-keto-L-gulonate-6-phosphate decarboxylase
MLTNYTAVVLKRKAAKHALQLQIDLLPVHKDYSEVKGSAQIIIYHMSMDECCCEVQ